MTPLCGRVGKVQEVDKRCVKLYFGAGVEQSWDMELLDASLIRYCHHGCALQRRVVGPSLLGHVICGVCEARVPVGAETQCCNEHEYDICGYCLGHSTLPPVGAKVIRGPTWTEKRAEPERTREDIFEEGIVETALLKRTTTSQVEGTDECSGTDDGILLGLEYHSYFRVCWLKSGEVSYCRGPPFQDVTLAHDNVDGLQVLACFVKLSQSDSRREVSFCRPHLILTALSVARVTRTQYHSE